MKNLLSALFFISLMTLSFGTLAVETDPAPEASQATAALTSVNINTADAQTLATVLKGVGLKKAEAIVTFRNENGPFMTIEELALVKGIGSKTVANNRPLITIE